MSIATRITSIEEHIGDIYDTLELGGADLTNVDKNLINISPALQQKYLDYMNNGTREIWNNWEKVTGTGKNVILNNTVQAPMDVTVKGNSEQVQYSGKNLAKVSGDLMTLFQNLVVNKNGNDITISGTATGDITSGKAFSIDGNSHTNYAAYLTSANTFTLKAGTYTLSINNISGSYSGINRFDIVLLKKKENTPYTVLKLFSLPTTKDTVTISEDSEECFIAISINYTQGTAITFSNYKFNIMLASGTDDTYEPYVGGTASPNPSYPQAISNVTGDVEVLVQNKNILRNDISYTSTYHDSKAYLDLNIILGTASTLNAKWIYTGRVDNIGRVYASFTTTADYTRFTIKHNGSTTDLTKTYDFDFKNGETYIISINLTGVNPTVDGGFSYNDVMITTGSADYEPHKEQTFTFPLGTQRMYAGDYLADDGIHHVRKQITFDGSEDENWSYYSNGGVTNRRFIISIADMKQGTNNQYPALSNRFIQKSSTEDNFIFITSSNKIVWFGSTELEDLDVAGFKTWLSTNNVIVEYELAEEEITPYTTEQQQAYDEIKQAISYEEQTNISGTSDESNPIFEVIALKNV